MVFDTKTDSQNIFFRCVEDSGEAIMITDRNGKLIYVNPAWCSIYGYAREEAIGNSPKLLHSGVQSDGFYREMWEKIRDPKFGRWKGELVNRTKDGSLMPVLLTITPYKGPDGANLGYMGIAVDVSYRRELEAKVAHQDRLASIGMLASGLAHEVGTPLGVVRGRAELLMMKTEDPEFRKNLDVIMAQIDRISKLIRSLLRISRSFSDVQLEDVSVQAVAQEVLLLLGQNLREEGVEVRIEAPEGPLVRADFGRLEQVLLNLFVNSIHAIRKARQDGRAGPHRLTVSALKLSSGKIRLSIEDTGCGIAQSNMKKLFKPFFTTKDVGEGTGLGLAIVAQIVREMEGEITVTSTEGVGTAFHVLLAPAGSS